MAVAGWLAAGFLGGVALGALGSSPGGFLIDPAVPVHYLTASRGTRYSDGTCEVQWPVPMGWTVQAILWADLRYVTHAPSEELAAEFSPNPAVFRIEVPGFGPVAQDRSVAVVPQPRAIRRGNDERDIVLTAPTPLPSPADSFPWDAISVRWTAFSDQPNDATGGLTMEQALSVYARIS